MTTYDAWKARNPYDEELGGTPGDDVEDVPGSLRLQISRTYVGRFIATSRNSYDGPGSMIGSGLTEAEAAGDFCEQYADHEVTAMLASAWTAINALGGTDGGDFNAAIGMALAVLESLGAPQGRRK
jgi:hypothetical protein